MIVVTVITARLTRWVVAWQMFDCIMAANIDLMQLQQ